MITLGGVVSNALEDTADDFVSTIIFQEQKKITDLVVKKDDGTLTILDEVLNNLKTQTIMGFSMYAYMLVVPYIELMATQLTLSWSYIVSGKLKQKIQNLKTKNIKGKKALNFLGAVIGSDKTAERIEVVKLAHNKIHHLENKIDKEKKNRMYADKRLLSLGATSTQIKAIASQDNFNLYSYKLKSSTWQQTATDKRLFEKITGNKVAEMPISWADLVVQLNSLSEFAKDTEGKIFNLTEAVLKTLNKAKSLK